MKRLRVDVPDAPYDVVVGTGALGEVGALVADRRRVVIVTQEAVSAYASQVARAIDAPTSVLTIAPGEGAKSMATVEQLCRDFATGGLLRGDVVVAVGGGVVGDTAGFAAAVYHRGIAVVQVPTTLLAQVDAAIGGKTAVNLPEGKNLVGAFHQPIGVLADTTTLETLSQREFLGGLGEVAKYALLGDAELAALLEDRADAVLARDPTVLGEVVTLCAAAKIAVVVADETERTGQRASLNYGHTLAHALESLSDYELSHGEAVAVGLIFAGALAGALERLSPAEVAAHRELVERLELPTVVPFAVTREAVLEAMARDKKSRGGVAFVLRARGRVETVIDPDPRALATAFTAVGIET